MRTLIRSFMLLFSLGLVAVPVLHAQSEATVGSHGELYLIRSDIYGELFPVVPPPRGTDRGDRVLALEVARPGAPTERYLVPQTGGAADESQPFLLYEQSSDTAYLIWESRVNQIHPVLLLAGFTSDDGWTAPIQILSNFVAAKTSPRIAVTRDSYKVTGEEQPRNRTFLHVVWKEDNGRGDFETLYLPIILENGAFIGKSPIFNLNSHDTAEQANGNGNPTTTDLLRSLRIQSGRDGQTVVVSFAAPDSLRMVSLEIDVLPAQLGKLADDARMHIIDIGRKLSYPAKLQQIADGARMHIIDIGARLFQPEIAQAIGDAVRAKILERKGADPIEGLAALARMHIIDIGARLSGRGLRNPTGKATTGPAIVEIDGSSDLSSVAPGSPALPTVHLLQFRVAASRPLPEVGAGAVTLFASKTGQDQLIAWAETDRVKYRMSEGDAWSELREILFSPGVDLQRAYEILDQRMDR